MVFLKKDHSKLFRHWRLFVTLVSAGLTILQGLSAQEKEPQSIPIPTIIPAPVKMAVHQEKTYTFSRERLLINPSGAEELRDVLYGFFNAYCPEIEFTYATQGVDLRFRKLETADPEIGDEGYYLDIDSSGIQIAACTRAGLFYGFQTLKQMVMEQCTAGCSGAELPWMMVTDYPAFPWRGMLLDCCRHFMEKDFILRYIDLLALYKMNTFHWHLTEDQGWRIEIDKYPLLTEVGAWRREPDGTLYGGFYSKDDIREVVAYAASRHITVVPEIEMPGHAMAALASYPSLSCSGGPFEVTTTWGVFKDIYCAGNDSVFIFLKDILDEVMELFPSEYIHIGGDEAPKYRWENCEKCKKRMADHHLKDAHALQSWFIGEMASYLSSHSRKLIGWDEILEGGLVNGVAIQSWQGFEGARHAAETGNDAVVSPTSHAYFDYPIHKITLEKVYSFDPVPIGLDPDLHQHILGGECNIWTERAPQELIDPKVFPRILAMAEVLWTDPGQRNYLAFRERVRRQYPMLAALGVDYGLEEGGLKIIAEQTCKGIFVTLVPEQDNISLYYKTGSQETSPLMPYTTPLLITDSLSLMAAAYIGEKRVSEWYQRKFNLHPGMGTPYRLSLKPGGTYNKNPHTTLTDGVRGTSDFHDGLWLGFWEKDLTIDFRFTEPKTISSVSLGVLQSNPSWIFHPSSVQITLTPGGFLKKKIRFDIGSATPKEVVYSADDWILNLDKPLLVKKIRIKAENPGKCPDWHPGAGSPTWIFLDEIEMR